MRFVFSRKLIAQQSQQCQQLRLLRLLLCCDMALTVDQQTFVDVLIETGIAAHAARVAGVPLREMMKSVPVQRAARDALAMRALHIAPKALSVLESLMDDISVPPAVRRLAASDILDRVGLVSQAALQLSKPLESLTDMPARDLRALVARLETELFARAKPVRDLEFSPPQQTTLDAKPLTILD
jgi:uncharacterized protein (UPF0147 family)